MIFIKEEDRMFIEDHDKIVAEINYKKKDTITYDIYHTYVSNDLRGQGIAAMLVETAVTEIEKKGYKVIASCSYAKKWLEENRGE